ncbi:MAG: efflux RND transporter periplasmic adaptor subunit [Neptuniibacter sp.]
MSEALQKKSTSIKWILPLLILLVAGIIVFYLFSSKPKAPSRPVGEKVWSVKTISIEPGNHQPALVLYGKIEAPRMTNITAAVTAFVSEVNTDEGKSMSSNELLLKLDDRDTKLLVAQRQADIANIEAQLEAEKIKHQSDINSLKIQQSLLQLSLNTVKRYENLNKRKVASQEQLDSARKDYQQQRLSLVERQRSISDHPNRINQINSQLLRASSLLEAAELDLSRTEIRAPFPGRIAKLSVSPGDRVKAGDSLLQFYSLERLEVRSQIPSRILPQLRTTHSKPEIIASGKIDNQSLKMKLDRIAAEVNGGSAGVDAFFTISSSDYLPEPGRSLAIEVKLPAQANVIPIPPISLYGLDRVYKVVEGRLQSASVIRIGDSQDQNGNPLVLVQSTELTPGDRIITTQLPNAISGLRVKEVSTDA